MKDFNMEDFMELFTEFRDNLSAEEASACLNSNVAFQMVFDNGQMLPLFRIPLWTLLQLFQDVTAIETGEITKEDIHKIGDGFKELVDSGIVDYNV